ncbi:outer membrane beta-barrel protein [uncultured Prevotella sp.]|uniref:outer membrane beta-barrel protein n=1 Tax=uncultured Prevotella sp. TaxID=159272 RepID=UPI0027E36760|nr:outer membrane beta-barrel protein [uncultured Prevotella sp.]
MKQNDWTSKLHERLDGHKATVPDGLWDKIAERLDDNIATAPAPLPNNRNRHKTIRLVALAMSAAASVAVVVMVALRMNDDTINNVASKYNRQAASLHNPATSSVVNAPQRLMARITSTTPASEPMAQTTEATLLLAEAAPLSEDTTYRSVCETPANDLQTITAPDESNSTSRMRKGGNANRIYNKPSATSYAMTRQTKHTHQSNRWNIGVHAEGITTDSRNTQRPMLMATRESDMLASGNPNKVQSVLSNAPLQLADYSQTKHHYHPMSFGLSVGYNLTPRLALTTGMVYTYASSDFTSSAAGDDIVETQRLHYIGVPLNLKYKVWGNNAIQTYAIAGCQADFNVSAKMQTGDITTDADKDRTQWSVGGAVGIQYNIIPRMGIYAEPGVRYYIDNKSSVETIFKEKKLNFNLQLGVRVEL